MTPPASPAPLTLGASADNNPFQQDSVQRRGRKRRAIPGADTPYEGIRAEDIPDAQPLSQDWQDDPRPTQDNTVMEYEVVAQGTVPLTQVIAAEMVEPCFNVTELFPQFEPGMMKRTIDLLWKNNRVLFGRLLKRLDPAAQIKFMTLLNEEQLMAVLTSVLM
jgi:hypothetical protein